MQRKRSLIWLATVGACTLSGLFIVTLFRSPSSTAPVSLIFLPWVIVFGALAGAAIWYVGGVILDLKAHRISLASFRVFAGVFIAMATFLFTSRYFLEKQAWREAQSPATQEDRFWDLHQQRFLFWGEKIKAALASNPSTPPVILEAMVNQGELLSLVGQHPSLPQAAMEKLAFGEFSYSRMAGIAANPRLTLSLMERLVSATAQDFPDELHFRLYQTYVLAVLASRENFPQPLFDILGAVHIY